MPGRVLILANPLSGRDVRRVAARASTVTHETKRELVGRIATGLDAMGVDEILVMREPFRIASAALENLELRAPVRQLEVGVTHSALDSVRAVELARDAGCDVIVSLGGDGTNRIIARTWPEAVLVPLSTGTNNVFPLLAEATSAGTAAGLVASGRLDPRTVGSRCKLVHTRGDGWNDVGVIDAVLLRNDHLGSVLPFDPKHLAAIVLTRGEPAAVGMSPIGGYLDPVGFADDCGLSVRLGPGRALHVPVSPGLFRTVHVASCERVGFGEPVVFDGPGIIAFDGDRVHQLRAGQHATLTVERDGPWIVDIATTLHAAAAQGVLVDPSS